MADLTAKWSITFSFVCTIICPKKPIYNYEFKPWPANSKCGLFPCWRM